MHRGPVSPPAYCLIMIDTLTSLYPIENFDHVVPAAGNGEQQDRLSDHLVARVSEYPLRGFVPARDDAFQIVADDRIVGRLDDRRQRARAVLAFAQRGFRRLSLGDIDDCRKDHWSVIGVDRVQTDLDRELAAILLLTVEIAPRAHRSRRRIFEKSRSKSG